MRILIVKLSSLGDLFHALPAVHAIKGAYPGCRIDWAVHSSYQSLVACFADIDRVIPVPRHQLHRQGATCLRELRQEKYDLVLDCQGLLKSALVGRIARSQRRIGPSFHREGAHLLYDAVAGPPRPDRHAVDQILDIADHLGIPRLPPAFPVAFPEQPRPGHAPHVVIAPVSRWPSKNWPPERFAATARELQQQENAHITLIGGPGEKAVCDAIAASLEKPHCRNLAGQTSLPQMGGIIASADLLLANDSGPVHMAAAIGIPTVVIFGPTDPVRIGPYGNGHQILRPETPCTCGRQRICKHPATACINQITATAVTQAAQQILQL